MGLAIIGRAASTLGKRVEFLFCVYCDLNPRELSHVSLLYVSGAATPQLVVNVG